MITIKNYSPLRESPFPDPRLSDVESGVLIAGGDFQERLLLEAYYYGIFPWPHEGMPLLWFSPKERGVLDFKDLKKPKSFNKWFRKQELSFTWNQRFKEVIHYCSNVPRKGQKGTWITQELLGAYTKLHKNGWAHSLECWKKDVLIGGLYGVGVSGVFSAESMFGLESNISKACLVKAVEEFNKIGIPWIDIQMVTDVTKAFGGKYIDQETFLKRLKRN